MIDDGKIGLLGYLVSGNHDSSVVRFNVVD